MTKPQTLKGFRDFLPDEKRQRDFVMRKVIEVFERYGFEPLETPTLEYAEVLLGKYGKEADKLVYTFKDKNEREVGLRYDQTVPVARVLVQYQQQLPKYFRRYQIQNVFRAEKPQKGRFREFTQCDIDIFGSNDPVADAEIIACTYDSFKNVGYPSVEIKINDRTVLFDSLNQFATSQVSVFSIIQSIDKLGKISEEDVMIELTKKGLAKKSGQEALDKIKAVPISQNLQQIIEIAIELGVPKTDLVFTPTLARGLDYYTGMIFEVFIPEYGTNSLGGGGRYDKLIAQLGGANTPAVGIAFGFDRMVEASLQLKLINTQNLGTQILVTIFDESLRKSSAEIARKLRKSNLITELFPNQNEKLDKQLKYADRKGIPYVIICGPEEQKINLVKLKNMQSKSQEELNIDQVIKKLKKSKQEEQVRN